MVGVKDEFYAQILKGLSGPLDGNTFEACAVDLLQKVYPSLTPMKGGGDDGRDGIFLTLGGRQVPLVCTTQEDVGANLRKSLKQYVAKGHKGKRAISATSRMVNSNDRKKLEKIAKEEGFTLVQVHDGNDFAYRLYGEKEWLNKLLGLASKQQALSLNPVTSRPVLSLVVHGREDVATWLEGKKGDCIIYGQPGSGKTFVVRDFIMNHGGLFVVSSDSNQIAAEVREKKPEYLVIDDAHLKSDLLRAVRQFRQDSGATYRIIATTWSMHKDEVKNELVVSDNDVMELGLLGRDTVLEIVKDCGIKGPDVLQSQIITQAEGKPGLASTLCQLALSGEAQKVYLGDSLGEHLEALFQKELGTDSLNLLAVVALGGNGGITLENAAKVLEISDMQAQTLATQLSFGGVISVAEDGTLSVRPIPLRYYLAKVRFFNGGAAVNPLKHLDSYSSLEDVVDVMIHAGLRGGKVDKSQLFTLAEKVGSPRIFAGYAAFGENEAKEVVDKYPKKALAEPLTYLTMVPKDIIPLLLDKAIGDKRTLHNNPQHPLRILQDWVKDILPGEEDAVTRKALLIDCLVEWRKAGKDTKVLAQALASAMTPFFETHRTDPGSGRSLSYARGHLSQSELKGTIDEWRKIKSLLTNLSGESWRPILETLHQWTYERVELNAPNEEQIRVLDEGARELLQDVAELSIGSPGTQADLRPMAIHLGLDINLVRDREYDILFPVEDDRRAAAWAENDARQRVAVSGLAAEYVKQNPIEVVKKVVALTKEADAASHSWPRLVDVLANDLAEQATSLTEWAEAVLAESSDASFVFPFLLSLQRKDPKTAKPILLKALKHDNHKYAAGEVILRRTFEDDELWQATVPILDNLGGVAEVLVAREQIDNETILHLLRAGGKTGLLVAESLAWKYKGNMPIELADDWEKAIVGYGLSDDYNFDSRLVDALQPYSAVALKWLKTKVVEEPSIEFMFDNFYQVAVGLIKNLTKEQRLELIRELPNTHRAERIARHLVGADRDLFEELLVNPNTKKYGLIAISGVSGLPWMGFAEVAFNAGADEPDVYAASVGGSDSWTGPASEHYKARAVAAAIGVKSSDPRIASVAQKLTDHYQKMSDAALERERKEDIYGFE